LGTDYLLKENEALTEDAVDNSVTKTLGESQSDLSKPLRRPSSLKSVPRQPGAEPFRSMGPRRTSLLSSHSAPLSASIPPVSATPLASDSWRVKSNPPPQHQQQQQIQSRASAAPTFIAPPPSALEQVESIADGAQDDLEVVDFSDMGKFVGASEVVEAISDPSPAVKINAGVLSRLNRPVASDFFDDEPSLSGNNAKESAFGVRRKTPQDSTPLDGKADVIEHSDVSSQVVLQQDNDKGSEDQSVFLDGSFSTDTTSITSMASTKEPLSHVDQEHGGQFVNVPLNLNSQRTPRNQGFYKEAAMSALDDAMSRIKGALVGMQVNEVPKDLPQTGLPDQESRATSTTTPLGAPKERWLPPALRPRNFDQGDEPQEVFLVTVVEPLRQTPPTGSPLVVRFPSVSRLPMESISKKQLHLFSRFPLPPRLDILSFDPPIHDISRKDLSVNSVLFRTPQLGYKGKFRYEVVLPRSRGPKVPIPTSKLPGVGAFGRPTISDDAITWRKTASSSPTKAEENMSLTTGLSTMSHSPAPPDPPTEVSSTSMPKPNGDLSVKSDSTPVRSRSQPKMPVGSAVAFYRDSRIDVVEAAPKPLVNFIVGSELEQTSETPVQDGKDVTVFSSSSNNRAVNSSQATVNGVTSSPSTSLEQSLPSLVSKTESKSSEDSVRSHCTYE
jgi:serine/arginine repetitive matrix protein 2